MIERDDVTSCCGSIPYNKNNFMCCNGILSPQDDDISCCNHTLYNLNNFICCNGMIFPRSDNTSCCGSSPYTVETHFCCRGRLSEQHSSMTCSGRSSRQSFIDYWFSCYTIRGGRVTSCCGDKQYDFNTYVCCNGSVRL